MERNYKEIKERINKLLQGYNSKKLESPLTIEELEEILGLDYNSLNSWDNPINWRQNEYGTQDVRLEIPTITEGDESITIILTVEVENDKITHIVDVDEE